MNKGIDYGTPSGGSESNGLGQTNIDKTTGIRYGVIPQHLVLQTWCDSSEADYGSPSCPSCGGGIPDELMRSGSRFSCPHCQEECEDWQCWSDEPLGHYIDDSEYKASQGGDRDIFVLKSPYYTRAQFCSPCAPGACHLEHPCEDGERAYCFGHDWFDDGVAPYPVYSVKTDLQVYPDDGSL